VPQDVPEHPGETSLVPRLDAEASARRTSSFNTSIITMNWRGKPLRSYRTIVQLIAATTTDTGLTVRAELDERKYPKAVKVTDDRMASINLGTRSMVTGTTRYRQAERSLAAESAID
jgi:Rhodopirellula transposase DDE domain